MAWKVNGLLLPIHLVSLFTVYVLINNTFIHPHGLPANIHIICVFQVREKARLYETQGLWSQRVCNVRWRMISWEERGTCVQREEIWVCLEWEKILQYNSVPYNCMLNYVMWEWIVENSGERFERMYELNLSAHVFLCIQLQRIQFLKLVFILLWSQFENNNYALFFITNSIKLLLSNAVSWNPMRLITTLQKKTLRYKPKLIWLLIFYDSKKLINVQSEWLNLLRICCKPLNLDVFVSYISTMNHLRI